MAFSSGTYYIDALHYGASWTGTYSQPTTLTYSFDVQLSGGSAFSSAQQQAALEVMQSWSNIANVTFREASFAEEQTGNVDLTFAVDNLGENTGGVTYTQFVGDRLISADVIMDDGIAGYSQGGLGYFVLTHETGHALGLKHPGAYDSSATPPFLPVGEDDTDHTVMSYYDGDITSSYYLPPESPMIYDIAAIQYLYGANQGAYNGGNVYSYNGASLAETIWDGGGNDTLTSAAYSGTAVLDLREGPNYWSVIGESFIWNAFGANIENAESGSGHDVLYGNDLANILTSSSGNDRLYGEAGSDSMYGGQGNDSLYGGNDSDLIRGGKDNDTINGNQGSDTIYGDIGNDSVRGGKEADFVQGNDGADYVYGDLGNDTVRGGKGADVLYGGRDSDLLYGDLGRDTLYGDLGDDTLDGGEDADLYNFRSGSGNDVITRFDLPGSGAGDVIGLESNLNGSGITSTAAALAAVSYAGGDAILDLGGGNSVTIDNIAVDGLTESDFLIFV